MKAWRPPRSSFKGKVRYPDPITEGLPEAASKARYAIWTLLMKASRKAALEARYAIRTLLMKACKPPRSSLGGKARYPDPINEGLEASRP